MASPFRTAAAVLGALVLLGAMYAIGIAATTRQRGGTTIVLVGLSATERSREGEVATCARSAAARAIGRGARLVIVPVARTPVDMSTTPADTRLPYVTRLDPWKATPQARKRLGRSADRRIAELLAREAPPGSSDQIAAATIAYTEYADPSGDTSLIFCADGHEVGPIDAFHDDLRPSRCRALLARARPEMADLHGATVVFGAAGQDILAHLPAARESQIRFFWTGCWAPAVNAHLPITYRLIAP
ncbi:MAG: hypothetical protein QOE65_2026 [Solirubrobacteraceae bacterium]|jgi:hypothetical protein|nr:hypothetical protein [Solirubrobacteraceae bacterium]